MSILIIGGAGYIGSHTVKYFLEQNEDIIVVDNLLTGHKEAILTDKFYNCDIRDKENLDKVFKENNIAVEVILKGLLEYEEIQNLYIDMITEAMVK